MTSKRQPASPAHQAARIRLLAPLINQINEWIEREQDDLKTPVPTIKLVLVECGLAIACHPFSGEGELPPKTRKSLHDELDWTLGIYLNKEGESS